MIGNLIKNSSWIFLAQVLVKTISFIYTIFLARNLGVENFGLFSAALAYFSLGSSLADFGFNRLLMREGARDRSQLSALLSNTLILRLFTSIILFFIFYILLNIFDANLDRVNIVLLISLAIIPQSVALTFDGVLVALEKLKLSSLGVALLSIVSTSLGIYLISSGYSTIGAASALILGQIIYALFMFLITFRQVAHFPDKINIKLIKNIIVGSLPYGVLGILGLLYFKIDTLLLSYMRGSYETGLYSAGFRFLEALVFIPSAFATAAFPVISRLHDDNNQQIKKIYFSALKYLGLISLVILVGYLLVLPTIISRLLPKYIESIEIIKILSLTIPLMFIHVPGALVLLTSDKYLKEVIWLSVLTLAFNLGANLLFIPQFGVYAAAWITVASEALSFVVFFLLLYVKILRKS